MINVTILFFHPKIVIATAIKTQHVDCIGVLINVMNEATTYKATTLAYKPITLAYKATTMAYKTTTLAYTATTLA